MTNAVNAILRAHIDGALKELLFKTSAEQVYLNDTDTLAPKLAEMVAAINLRAKTEDVNAALANMTPHIGDNGNWFIGEEDTGVKAQGDYSLTDEDIANIARMASELLAEGNSGVVLAEQSYSGFFGATATNGETVYLCSTDAPITFNEGEVYTVVFDGVSYECEAETFDSSGVEQIGISNYPYGSSGSDWFQISYGVGTLGKNGATIITLAEGDSHIIGIYKTGATRFLTDADGLALQLQIDEIEKQVKEIQDSGYLKGVTCTQAEYDAMVAAGTIDSTTLYAIVG